VFICGLTTPFSTLAFPLLRPIDARNFFPSIRLEACSLMAHAGSHQTLARLFAIALWPSSHRFAIAAPAIFCWIGDHSRANRIEINVRRHRPRRDSAFDDDTFVALFP
jgi:hypothetical protein